LTRARAASDPKPPKIFVTGYARFWNDVTTQCNSASWQYWRLGDNTFMTVALRQRMNTMVDSVNEKLQDAVEIFNDPRLIFVNYENSFNEEHFCERNDVQEPQKSSDSRPSLLFAQYNTPLGQLLPEPEPNLKIPVADNDTETHDLINGFLNMLSNSSNQVNPEYIPLNADDFQTASGGVAIPYAIARVFHPTQRGHQIIAHVIADKTFQALGITPPSITTLVN
jgi:hypothetical protein